MKLQSKRFTNSSSFYSLAFFLKKVRLHKSMSQLQVSVILGTTPQFISNFENSKCPIPLSYLKKLTTYYDIDPELVINLILKEERQKWSAKLNDSCSI